MLYAVPFVQYTSILSDSLGIFSGEWVEQSQSENLKSKMFRNPKGFHN